MPPTSATNHWCCRAVRRMDTLLVTMCDRGILKEHSMNSWYQWVPSPAMSLAGSVCATASSEVPWQRALLAATLMWMPLFCIGLIVLAWRSYTGRFYISSSPPGLGLRRLWLACSAAYAVRPPAPHLLDSPYTRMFSCAQWLSATIIIR